MKQSECQPLNGIISLRSRPRIPSCYHHRHGSFRGIVLRRQNSSSPRWKRYAVAQRVLVQRTSRREGEGLNFQVHSLSHFHPLCGLTTSHLACPVLSVGHSPKHHIDCSNRSTHFVPLRASSSSKGLSARCTLITSPRAWHSASIRRRRSATALDGPSIASRRSHILLRVQTYRHLSMYSS
jgi:hypothetical protein